MRETAPAARLAESKSHPTRASMSGVSLESLLDSTDRLSTATRETIEYIARHYDEPLRLSDFTALTARTPFQLIRAFRRELGTTPHAFLVRVRVAVGTTLLASGEPIAEIASAVGFADQAHFTRHFKRFHGHTPARHLSRGGALTRAGAAGDRYAAAMC